MWLGTHGQGSLPAALWDWGCFAMQHAGFGVQRKKNQVGMERLAALVQPRGALWWLSPPEQRAAQPALCWLHGLQLASSPLAHPLLVLQASWDTAATEGTSPCHALSWCWADLSANSHRLSLELEAEDFPSGEAGTGPSCLPSCCLPQAVGGILCGWNKLSLCSFCCAISFAVVCICCPLAQSS